MPTEPISIKSYKGPVPATVTRHEPGWIIVTIDDPECPAYLKTHNLRSHQFVCSQSHGVGLLKTTQLNPCHAGADEVRNAQIEVTPRGFRFVIAYGYPEDNKEPSGGRWYETLVATLHPGESFYDTLYRADARLIKLTSTEVRIDVHRI